MKNVSKNLYLFYCTLVKICARRLWFLRCLTNCNKQSHNYYYTCDNKKCVVQNLKIIVLLNMQYPINNMSANMLFIVFIQNLQLPIKKIRFVFYNFQILSQLLPKQSQRGDAANMNTRTYIIRQFETPLWFQFCCINYSPNTHTLKLKLIRLLSAKFVWNMHRINAGNLMWYAGGYYSPKFQFRSCFSNVQQFYLLIRCV